MVNPAQLTTFRKREATEAQKRHAKTASATISYETIGGVRVEMQCEADDPNSRLKQHGVRESVKLVTAAGFALPTLKFILTNAEGVENVAFMGNKSGQREALVFLGPKIGLQNKPHLTQGVSDAVYDGTTRWFGNPKQKAMVTTVVVHELGHVLHELMSEDVFWTEHEAATMSSPLVWGMAAAKVSQYAQKMPLEFVAEVFAGRIMGRKYSGDVKTAYQTLSGPEVAGFL